MASYVKFQLEDGTTVYVETTDSPKGSSGLIPGGKSEHTEQAGVSFEKSIESVQKMASVLMNNFREGFAQAPEEIQINFGLKASADLGGLFVARGGMEANYNVMLRWRSKTETEETEGSQTGGKNE